jgi:DNA-3-methyladenine glycosylase
MHSGTDLLGDIIWLEDRELIVSEDEIEISRRIGIDYAGEDARRPNRFVLKQKSPG